MVRGSQQALSVASLVLSIPLQFSFFLAQNQSLPGNCLLLRPATFKTGEESRRPPTLDFLQNQPAFSSILVVTRPQLKPVFSNNSFVFNKFYEIPASIEAERSAICHGNSRIQPPLAAQARNTKRTHIVQTNPEKPKQMSLSNQSQTNPISLPSRLPFLFLRASASPR